MAEVVWWRRQWVELTPDDYGLLGQRDCWKHRAEDRSDPLTVEKIRTRLDEEADR